MRCSPSQADVGNPRRIPHFSFETLSKWYTSGVPHQVARVFEYWCDRVEMDVEMLEEGEVISQTWCVCLLPFRLSTGADSSVCSESARVFGVDFKSVRTRGSQFKVESVMFRIAKPESFLLLSPNRPQVRNPPSLSLGVWLTPFFAGREAERRRMPTARHGAKERVLQGTTGRARLSIALSLSHDRLQLLLQVSLV